MVSTRAADQRRPVLERGVRCLLVKPLQRLRCPACCDQQQKWWWGDGPGEKAVDPPRSQGQDLAGEVPSANAHQEVQSWVAGTRWAINTFVSKGVDWGHRRQQEKVRPQSYRRGLQPVGKLDCPQTKATTEDRKGGAASEDTSWDGDGASC